MPHTGLSLRSRYKDSNKAAMEVAISKRPLDQEKELREQDRKYNRVAPIAVQRIKYLLDSPEHFIHAQKKSGKEQRQKTRDQKKALYLEISVTGKEDGHQWMPKGLGLQCQRCQTCIHQHMPMQQLRAAQEEKCELAQHLPVKGGSGHGDQAGLHSTDHGRGRSAGPSVDHPDAFFVCGRCGMRTLKNAAREKIEQLHSSPCWHGKWMAPATGTGNPTHELQRRGNKVWCQTCKACAIAKNGTWIPSEQLKKPCGQAIQQLQLPQCFQARKRSEKNIIYIYIYTAVNLPCAAFLVFNPIRCLQQQTRACSI